MIKGAAASWLQPIKGAAPRRRRVLVAITRDDDIARERQNALPSDLLLVQDLPLFLESHMLSASPTTILLPLELQAMTPVCDVPPMSMLVTLSKVKPESFERHRLPGLPSHMFPSYPPAQIWVPSSDMATDLYLPR